MTTSVRGPDAALLPSVADTEFRHFMRQWPIGVAIVTTAATHGPIGCTVNAMMSLSVDPPLLVVSLCEDSRTLEAIRRTGLFGASVLSADQGELSQRFAYSPPEERFVGLVLHVQHGVPLLADAAARAVCTVRETMPCADHVLVTGAPIWQSFDPDRSPLLMHRGTYRRIAR
jgi:flavin reductase (DIM6/NTAB) family NADH-FMN oxidoreductase RutF